ncbi:tetratricopeptide repeat-containing sulfotransferase family protein [Pseudoalteromonas mariniglutinosa]|uniref:tetratricopeptide repeat-containing sulfotransferase family protein n=1 Tax=Pseudoalteromonas mariniglutinosa TaxID=206042 RepID=UPI00384E5781
MLLKKANQLLADNKLKDAEFYFKTLLEADPDNGEALFGLGRIALRLARYDAAVYLLQRACEKLPYMLEPLHALADAFNGVGSAQDALTVLEYAKSIASHNPEPHYYLAQHYLTYGELDKAHTTLAHALTLGVHPVTAYILFELVQLGRFDKEHNYISNLHHLLTQTNNLHLKMVCYYALGKSYDQLNDVEQAFNYYQLANKLQFKLSDFSTEQLQPFYQKIINYSGQSLIARADKSFTGTITPVFIIGMPRSGSTLVEQLLLSHKDFASLGEDASISNHVVAYLEQQTALAYPECLRKLTSSLLKQARELYIQSLKNAATVRPFMINKLPANYQSLGLIYILFPNAKFINMQRDFNAIAWSVFSNYFAENEPYFCSLPEFKLYYELYQQLMAHWQTQLSDAIYNLSYEQLVSEPEPSLRALCKFLGTHYDAGLLNFYKSNKPVTTLSKAAVRAPINEQAKDKWKRYESLMLPLLNMSQTNQVDQ